MLDTCVQYLLEFPLCSANKNSQYVLEEYRLKEYGTTKSEEGGHTEGGKRAFRSGNALHGPFSNQPVGGSD